MSAKIGVEELTIIPEMQLRAKTDAATVKRYAQAMAAGAVFPPLEVAEVEGVLLLIDGFHRLEALKSRGERRTAANVRQAASLEEARWWAAQANLTHGLPLRPAERRRVFGAYVKASQHRHGGNRRGKLKSYREMSTDLTIPHTTLRNWMRSDFPTVFAALTDGGENARSLGGLPEGEAPDAVFIRAAVQGLEAAGAALAGVTSARDLGELLKRVEELREALVAAGAETVEEEPF